MVAATLTEKSHEALRQEGLDPILASDLSLGRYFKTFRRYAMVIGIYGIYIYYMFVYMLCAICMVYIYIYIYIYMYMVYTWYLWYTWLLFYIYIYTHVDRIHIIHGQIV